MDVIHVNAILAIAVNAKNKMKKRKIENKINKNMTFSELIDKFPESVEVLLENGMHCFGCPMSAGESLEQGCLAHGLNPDKILKDINIKLKGKR